MIDIRVSGKLHRFPENWDEVPDKTKHKLINLFYETNDAELLKMQAVFILLNISLWQKPLFPVDAMTILLEKTKWLLSTHPRMDHNPYTQLGGLHGTGSILKSFRLWEFILAEQAFKAWVDEPTPKTLDHFLAHWYRPRLPESKLRRAKRSPDWDGDERRQFLESELPKWEKELRKAPFGQKVLIAHFFANELESLIRAFPHIHQGGKADGDYTWADTILYLSPINEEDRTARNKLSTILRRLENEQRTYERTKG